MLENEPKGARESGNNAPDPIIQALDANRRANAARVHAMNASSAARSASGRILTAEDTSEQDPSEKDPGSNSDSDDELAFDPPK